MQDSDPKIHSALTDHLEQMLAINESAVPHVNSIPREQMQWFIEQASYCRVAVSTHSVVGLLIALRPGADYASPNYKWFETRYDRFLYIDRIIVTQQARGQGLGQLFYDDLCNYATQKDDMLACEVNSRPANDQSMRFHIRYGFAEAGRQSTEGGNKEVVLMTRTV